MTGRLSVKSGPRVPDLIKDTQPQSDGIFEMRMMMTQHDGAADGSLKQGERSVAWIGLAMTLILIAALGGAGWWSMRLQEVSRRALLAQQAESVADLLADSAAGLLGSSDLSRLRRMVIETSRTHGFEHCRLVAGGVVLADIQPKQITSERGQALADRLAIGPMGVAGVAGVAGSGHIVRLVRVPGLGSARLEIKPGAALAHGRFPWEWRAGLTGITVGALILVLLIYRVMRKQAQTMGAIRGALLAQRAPGSNTALLKLSGALGAEASAFNGLLAEIDELRQGMLVAQTAPATGSGVENQSELVMACDVLPQGLIVVNDDKLVRYANGAAGAFLQLAREELIGQDLTDFIEDAKITSALERMSIGEAPQRLVAEVKRGEDGIDGVLRFVVRPMRQQDAGMAMIVIEDITQQRVAEDARNAFVAQATHELRTPLSNIVLYVESAIEDGADDEALVQHSLNVINQEAQRLNRVVSDMLSVSEIEAGTRRLNLDDLRLEGLFESIEQEYQQEAAEEKVSLHFELPPKLPVIQADRDKVLQAVHNLISNALKYTPEGGEVRVMVAADQGVLSVSVEDSGVGIAADDLERVFEKFYRTDDARLSETTGSGLGLAIAREVIRLHGGEITVESELDRGSRFTLTIPIGVGVH